MRFLPSFKCCIGKTGIELDLLSEISSIFTGLHSEIFKWQQPSKHNFYQVFLHFLIWHPSNGVCCISCPSAALIQSYFCNTPNWQWIEDWLFPGFFAVFSWTWIEDCHQISLQESLETPWNTTLATWISSIWTTGGWDAEFASSIWKIGVISSIFESFSIQVFWHPRWLFGISSSINSTRTPVLFSGIGVNCWHHLPHSNLLSPPSPPSKNRKKCVPPNSRKKKNSGKLKPMENKKHQNKF